MISPRDPHLPWMLRYIDRPLAVLVLFHIAVVVAYVFFEQRWLGRPNLPLPIAGAALGLILGFRNNVSYARWWEARTLWGRIVNYSRCVGRQAVAYISAGHQLQDSESIRCIQRRIVLYHLAYVNSLRCQLRGQDPLPELEPFLSQQEIDTLRGQTNTAAEIQRRIALLLDDSCRRGWLDVVRLRMLDDGLTELANAQGGCERIKNTPVPRSHEYFIRLLVYAYCVLLPLGMVANLGLLTPLGSALLAFVFLALDNFGRDLDRPFDNAVHDVPMTPLCRTIERNLRQYLGESDLPAPVEPVRGVLW